MGAETHSPASSRFVFASSRFVSVSPDFASLRRGSARCGVERLARRFIFSKPSVFAAP